MDANSWYLTLLRLMKNLLLFSLSESLNINSKSKEFKTFSSVLRSVYSKKLIFSYLSYFLYIRTITNSGND
ncbi:MAG TPA: hypothetical protein PLI57_12950, partial [Spirochaetota bacterium]|nr:hypothetical protein [Spirochaetota bacterium]